VFDASAGSMMLCLMLRVLLPGGGKEGQGVRLDFLARVWIVSLSIVITAFAAPPRPVDASELVLDTQDFSPFSYEVNGVVSGPAADVIRRVCAEIKVDCPMRLLPWRRAQQEVTDGKAHGMFLIGWNAERAKWLYFSPPFVNTEYGFFVRDDNPLKYTQLSDVKGYTVGVFGPSNTATSLEKIKADLGGDLIIDMTPDDGSAFRKASLGRVRAAFSNRDVGYDVMKKLGITNLRYSGRQQSLKYYVGFSQKFADKKLVDQFNEAFRTLHKQGVIQDILGRYHMDAAPLD
jgi:polar amino acid transport system substrate-binding protein